MTFVQGHKRTVAVIGNITAICLLLEIGLIILQVVRGTTSHFNVATAFDSKVFAAMGVLIGFLWFAGMGLAVLLLRQKLPDSAWAWALRLSIISSLVGMMAAGLMLAQPGAQPGISGAHWK
jgi:hypothetical protein